MSGGPAATRPDRSSPGRGEQEPGAFCGFCSPRPGLDRCGVSAPPDVSHLLAGVESCSSESAKSASSAA